MTQHFQDGGQDYARHRPSYPASLIDNLAVLSPTTNKAIDVGCGTGQISIMLADRFTSVLATDISADQLAHAPKHPRILWRQGRAENLNPDDDGPADLIIAAQAAHWFDLDAFYPKVRATLSPGGLIALVSYGVLSIDDDAANKVFQHFYSEVLGPFWPPERHHVETSYRELTFPFTELTPPELTIERDWALADLMGYVRTWSATKSLLKNNRSKDLQAFEDTLASLWGEPAKSCQITWPIAMRLGRA